VSVETIRWTLAVMISIALHAAFFIGGGGGSSSVKSLAPVKQITHVQFRTALTMTPPREEKPPALPQKVVMDRGDKATARKPVAAEQQEVQASQVEESTSEQAVDSVVIPSSSTATVDTAANERGLIAVRARYARALAAHIERYKYYPETARRRGIVGGVRVAFIVSAQGVAAALECDRGPSALTAAACEAVRRAMPLPVPPPELASPMPVSFVMDFSLK
jgi:protein TonB